MGKTPAVILAGGKGERKDNLCYARPRPTVSTGIYIFNKGILIERSMEDADAVASNTRHGEVFRYEEREYYRMETEDD